MNENKMQEKEYISEQRGHNNEFLTREEMAKLLRITLPTLDRYTRKGLIPSIRIGYRVIYRKDDVIQSIKNQ